ncbi:MAG: hypothetical protein NTW76_13445 [Corynebacteriales bacterium]|nr:hypothetical protein [Mycobacteriales bacterium]
MDAADEVVDADVAFVGGAACRGPDDGVLGASVGAGSVVVVWVGELEPPEPAGVLDAPSAEVEVVGDDGVIVVDVAVGVEDGADDEGDAFATASAPEVPAGALFVVCPPLSWVTGAVSATAVPVPAAHAPAIATAPPASFATRTQFRLAFIDIPRLATWKGAGLHPRSILRNELKRRSGIAGHARDRR